MADETFDVDAILNKARARKTKPCDQTNSVGILDPQDPMRSARELVASHFTTDKLRTLHRHRGVFWSWTGNCYRLAGGETIRASIWAFLEMALRLAPEGPPKPFKPNRARVG